MKQAAVWFVACFMCSTRAWAADAALATISLDELRSHVETLAADSFEGREAGARGGHAASAYLLSELKRLDVLPAGGNGTFVQEFGAGYRNILAAIPGSDERLKSEVVVIGAHYDHVGFGSKTNSFGPLGRIHNGADDNASGTAALLELIEAFSAIEPKPKRTLLFAFWDAEEKGLLGSAHWAAHPTVSLESVRFAFNFDMLGRMRNRTLEIYGVRTATGLRKLLTDGNGEIDLTLAFDWTHREDSDHWSFYKRRIPYLMLHTGLHDEYHRPTDDANLINIEGLHEATQFCHAAITAVADTPVWTFRDGCTDETNETNLRLSEPLSQPKSRLGIAWDGARGDAGEFIVTAVQTDSPAAAAGVRIGDRVTAINGVHPLDTGGFRRIVLAAPAESLLTIARGGENLDMRVRLDGRRIQVGITWRTDEAEPGVVILRRVIAGSPADEAGLKATDRVLAVNGEGFHDETEFRKRFRAAGSSPELLVERNGRLSTATLRLDPDVQ